MIKIAHEDLDAMDFSAQVEDGMTYHTVLTSSPVPSLYLIQWFASTEARDAFLALMPKSYRFKVNGPTSVINNFNFHADDRTGAVNETAIKRLRSIIKKFDTLGLTLTHKAQRIVNPQPNLDELLAIVDPE